MPMRHSIGRVAQRSWRVKPAKDKRLQSFFLCPSVCKILVTHRQLRPQKAD